MTYSEKLERFTERTGIKTGGIKFLHFVLIPIAVLFCILLILLIIPNDSVFNAICLCILAASLVVDFILLFTFDHYSYISCLVTLGLFAAFSLYVWVLSLPVYASINLISGGDAFLSGITSAVTGFTILVSTVMTIVWLVILASIWGYLHKRKELFRYKPKSSDL
jgi:prepilin signal peptidase PulO-like enzyme (type II secretory pathway)